MSIPSIASPQVDIDVALDKMSKPFYWDLEELLNKYSSSTISASSKNHHKILLICRERDKGLPIEKVLRSIVQNRDESNQYEIAFLIGPEGGWSAKEEALFDEYEGDYNNNQNIASIQSISLFSSSGLVLRAETCAIAVSTAWGLFDSL